MRTADLDYELPPERLAQEPLARREDARLLVLPRREGSIRHRRVADWPEELRAGDLVVLNDSRVLAARLHLRRVTGGAGEILLLEPDPSGGEGAWRGLLRTGGAVRAGETLHVEGTAGDGVRLVREVGEGEWVVAPSGRAFGDVMRAAGHPPVPPYIRRARNDPREPMDRERYQTVFARNDGSVAAPSAGMHLSWPLLDEVRRRGVALASVTLHVGLGTFLPVKSETLEEHPMHEEAYEVPVATADAVRATRAAGGRVVAVGTTAVRALESASLASPDGLPRPGAARTSLLIAPGHAWRAVDALLTCFHLPRSTLLALVAAFAGRERILAAYREALALGYRFDSYGDAMFLA